MIAAGFTGGEAEQLRRAMGFKRSEARMKQMEGRLRSGMEGNGITGETQDRIVKAIGSFALYGFPESHAASFALLAYASAYLKVHYPTAFTAALLNNQPMGFYHPSTIVKDAQRHGVRLLPIDAARSGWSCSIEEPHQCLRLGLGYVKGLREAAGRALVRERQRAPFSSIDELARRVPQLRQEELRTLAGIGALNSVGAGDRRDALWQAERAARPAGPLFAGDTRTEVSPLVPMNDQERLVTDYRSTGLTIGRHPMAFRRAELDRLGVRRASELAALPTGGSVRVAGLVIVRQRPGTAKGFLFLSLEDETGISNIIVMPDLYESSRRVLVEEPFLMVDGVVQNQDHAISVKARRVWPLVASGSGIPA